MFALLHHSSQDDDGIENTPVCEDDYYDLLAVDFEHGCVRNNSQNLSITSWGSFNNGLDFCSVLHTSSIGQTWLAVYGGVKVAAKVSFARTFQNEYDILKQLQLSKWLVQAVALEPETTRGPALILKLYGSTMRDRINNLRNMEHELKVGHFLTYVTQLAQALQVVHAWNIVHGDISVQAMIWDDEQHQVILGSFGKAHKLDTLGWESRRGSIDSSETCRQSSNPDKYKKRHSISGFVTRFSSTMFRIPTRTSRDSRSSQESSSYSLEEDLFPKRNSITMETCSQASDILDLAYCAYEIWTGSKGPKRGIEFPEDIPMRWLWQQCVHHDPDQRPNIIDILHLCKHARNTGCEECIHPNIKPDPESPEPTCNHYREALTRKDSKDFSVGRMGSSDSGSSFTKCTHHRRFFSKAKDMDFKSLMSY